MDSATTTLLVGIFFILLGGLTLWLYISKRIKCTEETEGEVIEVKRKAHRTGRKRSVDYSPVLSYMVDGAEHSGLAEISSVLPNKFQVGQTMMLKYNPEDPDKFVVAGKIGDIKWSIFALVLGVIFLILRSL